MANVYHKDLTGDDLHIPKVHNNTYHSETYLTAVSEHGAEKHTDRTRTLFVPVMYADDGVSVSAHWGDLGGGKLTDGATKKAFGQFKVPADYSSSGVVKAVVVPVESGDMFYQVHCYFASSGESRLTHYAVSSSGAEAVVQDIIKIMAYTVSLTGITTDDFVMCRITRTGGSGLDTVNDDVWVLGFIFEYTADM